MCTALYRISDCLNMSKLLLMMLILLLDNLNCRLGICNTLLPSKNQKLLLSGLKPSTEDHHVIFDDSEFTLFVS